jgi:hypothetical protein
MARKAKDTRPEKGIQAAAETGSLPQAGADSAPATNPASTMLVRVTGPKRGRWRAGRHFGPEPVDIAAGDLTEAEIAALAGDPALSVEMIETAEP